MQIQIIAVSKKVPGWISEGFLDYAKRFPKEFQIELTEIAAEKQSNQNATIVKEREGQRILAATPPSTYTVALDVAGKSYSTELLSQKFAKWQAEHSKINFLIGGAEGLSRQCLEKANELWSLSPLTFPHALVRIMLIEQLYRSMTLLQNHPYHR